MCEARILLSLSFLPALFTDCFIVSLRVVVWGSVVITAASLSELLRAQGKGTDASNVYDEEVRCALLALFTHSGFLSTR